MKYFSSTDFVSLEKRYRTKLINSLSGFKSLNLIGTTNLKGIHNLSIVSSCIHIGANPPLMGFIMRPITVPRDTYSNIMKTGYFTMNHVASSFYQKAHQCSARYATTESEFAATGLSPTFKNEFPAPYVAESKIQIGLQFREQLDISINGTILIIGEIKEMYVPTEVIGVDGYIDIQRAGTITCSSLDAYHTTNKLKRLSYAKKDQPLVEKDF